MFPLAAAAYSDDPNLCLTNTFNNSEFKNQYVVEGCAIVLDDTCSGYTSVLHDDKAIVLSFRGTESYVQLGAEVFETTMIEQVDWEMGGTVNRYFASAFEKVWENGMADDFAELSTKYSDYQVWITGHSLGGSMSSLAASYIIGSGLVEQKRVKLVNFGSPRTGNFEYAQSHNNLVPYSFRVVHNRDLVTAIPKEDYYHTQREVVYNEDMAEGEYYHVCKDYDVYCIYYLRVNIFDHFTYFNHPVGEWGRDGCVTN